MKEYIIADKQRLDEIYREIAHDIETKPVKVAISDLRGKTKKATWLLLEHYRSYNHERSERKGISFCNANRSRC